MSINAEVDGIVTLPGHEERIEAVGPEPQAEPARTYVAYEAAARRGRPAWIVPGAIAAVGLIVAGALGYLVYSTTQQRDALHIQLVATKTTLASTQATLTAAQTEAASRKVTADYVALYVGDQGKVQTDYQNVVNCNSYSECRTAAQQMLSDMQAFQSDRKSANVPSAMTSTDSSLGDSLSAAIASDQEFITGMDNDDAAKIKDGFTKLGAAMLNVAKAESSIGTELN